MPRILLISYHFYPMDVVASVRAKRIADSLSSKGWELEVLTHSWKKTNRGWQVESHPEVQYDSFTNYKVIRIGVPRSEIQEKSRTKLIRKFLLLMDWMRGWLDHDPSVKPAHRAMQNWLFNEPGNRLKYDKVLVIFSPHAHLRLGAEIAKRAGIPVYMDFRDLWDNTLVSPNYKRQGIYRIKAPLIEYYWRRWISRAAGLSTVSKPLSDYLSRFSGKPCKAIPTGYDPTDFPEIEVDTAFFRVIYAGSVYNHQYIDLMLQGLKLFLLDCTDPRVKIEFIGSERSFQSDLPGSYVSGISERIQDLIPDPRAVVSPRIPQAQLRAELKKASVLLMPGFNAPGIYSGKFFDYLGAQRFILSAPRDQGVVVEMIEQSGAGECVNTPAEIAAILKQRFEDWQSGKPFIPAVSGSGDFGLTQLLD